MLDKEKYRTGQQNEKDEVICGAKTKTRQGEPCEQTIVSENGRCRMHGGTTPVGVANPNTIHGRYSKVLGSADLATRFQKSLDDPQLIELNHEIGIVDIRVEMLLERVLSPDKKVTLWKDLADTWRRFLAAASRKDTSKQNEIAAEIGQLIDRGENDNTDWEEIAKLFELRRKLSDTERKRRIDAETMITADEALVLINRWSSLMLDAVNRHVADPNAANKIRSEVSQGLRAFALP